MMNDALLVWEPIENLPFNEYVISLVKSPEFFVIDLRPVHISAYDAIRLIFEGINIYRRSSLLFNAFFPTSLHTTLPDRSLGAFFKVANSSFIRNLQDESCGILAPDWVTHYLIFGKNFSFEFVTESLPVVKLIKS